MVLERFELGFLRLIQSEYPSIWQRSILLWLHLASWPYQALMSLRRWGYRKGWLSSYKMSVPVISVGNLSTGGTGKTPVVLRLAQDLSNTKCVAILTRGYRSPAEKRAEPLAVSLGNGLLCGVDDCGDEAFLLASRCPQVMVIAGPDRVKSAHFAIQHGAQVLILDDGFQHLRLCRDLDIVAVNGDQSLTRGYCLPRGLLREGVGALKAANCVVVVKGSVATARRELANTPFRGPIVEGRLQPLQKGQQDLSGIQVAAFCGLAQPEAFFQTLRSSGAQLSATWALPDHHAPSLSDLQNFLHHAKSAGATQAICTEKDWVKLPHLDHRVIPIHYLPMRLSWEKGKSLLDKILSVYK